MHDLWIFPAPRASRWFARMDWYLNWQMSKGLSYAGLHLPEETYRTAADHGVALDVATPESPPLLVLPGSRVPAKKCLVLDGGESSLDEWLGAVARRAAPLNVTTARVFLPAGATVADAESAWSRLSSPFAAQFEADAEART